MKNNDEWKEVWHVWADDVNKLGLIREFLLSGGDVVIHGYDEDCYQINAIAYTTGQMRRRVECGRCAGFGTLNYKKWDDCPSCNGKGYVWEYKE